jgi:hypothetical protein
MASALPPTSVWLKDLGARHSASHSTLLQQLVQVRPSLSSFRIRDSAPSGVLGAKLVFVNLLYLSKFGFTVLVIHVILYLCHVLVLAVDPRFRRSMLVC